MPRNQTPCPQSYNTPIRFTQTPPCTTLSCPLLFSLHFALLLRPWLASMLSLAPRLMLGLRWSLRHRLHAHSLHIGLVPLQVRPCSRPRTWPKPRLNLVILLQTRVALAPEALTAVVEPAPVDAEAASQLSPLLGYLDPTETGTVHPGHGQAVLVVVVVVGHGWVAKAPLRLAVA